MLAARVRSGVVETIHDGAVAVCAPDGSLHASHGDIDRPFLIRSAAKPFQAWVSQDNGAAMTTLQLAQASASHRGHPVHIAIVAEMLSGAGLVPGDLGCPPDWPTSQAAGRRLAARGETAPRRIWHNCSGKHAAFLRACESQQWPTQSYLEPVHPLQVVVGELISELGRFRAGPPGIDGCGAPVFETTARALAMMYARLGADPDLREVFDAMHSYPALVAENGAGDSSIATALHAVAKGGAQGCMGVSLADRLGVGVKSWDGLGQVATVAAVAALGQIGEVNLNQAAALDKVARPPVLGGGRQVGVLEPRLDLTFS